MRNQECTCDQRREVNGHRSDGRPVALWTCPKHGNVFEDRQSDITLTPFQEEVLATISREHHAGRDADADDVSRLLNRSVASVERAMAVLQSINFIEPSTHRE